MVEEFKEWSNDNKKAKSVRGGAISSLVWTLTILIYLLLSFWTGAWYITWILFLVAVCIEAVVTLVFRIRELR